MPKYTLMIARFPGNRVDGPEVTDWLVANVVALKSDPRFGDILPWKRSDTPITMARNECLKVALHQRADFVLMVDNDMSPDLYYAGNPNRVASLAGTKPFLPTAFNFMVNHAGPCVVGAPYCGPPPWENVYVFRWANRESNNPNADMSVEQYGREEAAVRAGFEEVAALPTGVILIDMRALSRIKPPYFEYEWEDPPFNTKKATTEDVYFTRNLSLAGVPQYVLWDAWAGHWKWKCVGKPSPPTIDSIRKELREAVKRNQPSGEKLVMVGEGETLPAIPPLYRRPWATPGAMTAPLSDSPCSDPGK